MTDLVKDIILGVEFIIGYTTTQNVCQDFLKESTFEPDEDGNISETPFKQHPCGTMFGLCFTSLFILAVVYLMWSHVQDMNSSGQGTLVMSIDEHCGYILEDGSTNYLKVIYDDDRAVAS